MKKVVNPALIIGLGGTGHESVFQTKLSLLKRYGEVPECIKLICFDTDVNSLKQKKDKFYYTPKGSSSPVTKEIAFESSEICPIPIENPAQLKNENWIKSWLHENIRGAVTPSMNGASQIRQKGRFAFFSNFSTAGNNGLTNLIGELLNQINDYSLGDNPDYKIIGSPRIHMVFSPAGGTGGGTFMDFGTILKYNNPTVDLSAWMVLPSFYENFPACRKVHANAYGSIKEIDHMMGLDNTPSKPWSNYDTNRPRKVNYGIGGEVILEQTIFDKIYVFDNIMENKRTIETTKEVYMRIGELMYEMISGPGDTIFKLIESNLLPDMEIPSSDNSGNKRRNYMSIGIGHLSINKTKIKDLAKLTLIESILREYSGSGTNQISSREKADNFLTANHLDERGDGQKDDIIDALFDKNKDLKYDKINLIPEDLGGGCHMILKDNCNAEIQKQENNANKIVSEKYPVKLKQFKEALDNEINNMLSQSGGLIYSKNTLSTLLGLFQTMKQQMEEESERAISEAKNKSTKEYLNLVKEEENSIMPFGRKARIQEECEAYVSVIDQIIHLKVDGIRKKEAQRLIAEFISYTDEKINHLNVMDSKIQSLISRTFAEIRSLESENSIEGKFNLDLLKYHPELKEINIDNKALINGYDFSRLSRNIDEKELYSSLKVFANEQQAINNIDKLKVEEVLRSLNDTHKTTVLDYLQSASSPCASIDPTPQSSSGTPLTNISFISVGDKSQSKFKDEFYSMLSSAPQGDPITNGDDSRITFVQCQGPFTANSILSLKESKRKYIDGNKNNMGYFHSDTYFESAMDLYKDDSIKDALLYFGIGSILGLIECGPSSYIINYKGDKKNLHEAGARNKKNRDHAFNYFNKVEDYINYVKAVYEDELRNDPVSIKEKFLNHFDTIETREVLKKLLSSLDESEKDHINKERLEIANHAIDNLNLSQSDYQQRKDKEGNIIEKYSRRDLMNAGLKFD
ncbi:tubulin-like doman-containing protein [Crocinitomicaceae bacterium]|nr:tubulin-like doman-containing protein [Crocinitomicaceae bacterium]MDC3308998.1 tubulin-like doman-containing protein [Crocinitomicaceae bacterium]